MQLTVIPTRSFFKPIDSSLLSQFPCSHHLLSSFFSETGEGPFDRKLSLTEEYLIISCKRGQEYHPTLFLELEDSLLFQNLHQSGETNPKTPLNYAISLVNGRRQAVRVFFQFEGVLDLWAGKLADQLNQIGFHEQFKIQGRIGRGSTSTVYRVVRARDGRVMAAKVFLRSYLQSKPERRESVENEIALLRAIDHKNILKIHGVFQSNTALYLVTEHLEGGTLIDRINRTKGLQVEEIRTIMRGVVEGLAHLHRFGVMHRDLKLENIMFREKDSLEVVLVDFGLAAISEDEHYIFYRCGTPGYIAPEIVAMEGEQRVDPVCDVFSAGVILHILMTNRYLFEGQDNQEIYKNNKALSFDLSDNRYSSLDQLAMHLLTSMLELDPCDRPSSAQLLDHPFLADSLPKQQFSPAVTTSGQQSYHL